MYPSVIEVIPEGNHLLLIDFSNGESGVLDMKPYLDFGVFQTLKNPHVFSQVHVSFDTIAWNSGVDLDPEFVYTKCQRKSAPNRVALDFSSPASPAPHCH